ncbi:phosphoribosylglycinamide formyltransferase [bacterium]
MGNKMKNIAVLVSGGGSNLQAIIDAIETGFIRDAKISCVISSKEDAFGLKRARNHNIESIFLDASGLSREEYTEKIIETLNDRKIDLVCLAGFMMILSPKIVQTYSHKIINIHPALLPKFGGKGMYGIHVHEKVIEEREKYTGATVHFVDEGCDTGSVIIQEKVEVNGITDPKELQQKVLKIEHKIYPIAVKMFIEEKI